MKRKPKTKGYLLPDQLDDHPTRCVPVVIPDDPQYARVFFSHLSLLGKWWMWEHGEPGDTRAKTAAEYWRHLLYTENEHLLERTCEGEAMPFDVRQKTDAPCTLEKTFDGVSWETWANLRLCPPKLRQRPGGGLEFWDEVTGTWEPVEERTVEDEPPRTGSEADNRCLAAANAVNVLEALHQEVSFAFTPGILSLTLALALVSAILGLIGVGLVAVAIAAPVGGLLLYTASLTASAFTAEVRDELRCILFCAASDSDGIVTFDFAEVQSEVSSRAGLGDIWNVLNIYLLIITEGGLNLAGATTAISEAVCDCPDCYECVLALNGNGRGDWIPAGEHSYGLITTTYTPDKFVGAWAGVSGTYKAAAVRLTGARNVSTIRIHGNVVATRNSAGQSRWFWIKTDGVQRAFEWLPSGEQERTYTLNVSVSSEIWIEVGAASSLNDAGCIAEILEIEVCP